MENKKEKFNTGLKILEHISPREFIAGDFSPLIWRARTDEEKGFWLNFIPKYEVQNDFGVDKMNCTTMATDNSIETDLKEQNGIEINISDRFVSVIAGNTKSGNFVNAPIEAIMQMGFVMEDRYPEEYKNQPPSWDEYYKGITSDLEIDARVVLDNYQFDREFVTDKESDNLYQKLHEAPLKATVLYASAEDPETILNPKGKNNHDIIIVGAKYGEYWIVYDSYAWQRGWPTLKRYAWNYQFGTVMRIHVELKNNNTTMIFKQNYPYLLVEGNEQKFGFFLDGELVVENDWSKILVQSASRLKRYEPAIPLKLIDWNSVPHVNLKGEPVE